MKRTKSYQIILLFFFYSITCHSSGFNNPDSSHLYNKRLYFVIGGSAIFYTTSMVGLWSTWYTGYPRSAFHFYNDNKEWLQFDKFGHTFCAYYESLAGIELLKWSGVKDKDAKLYGCLTGLLFQTTIEVFDGFSKEWGFSYGDMIGNCTGTLFAYLQNSDWNKQNLLFKYSIHTTGYENLRPSELGNNLLEYSIKDYNGITFWLSFNPNIFSKSIRIMPKWLCLSVGYGVEGLLGGPSNPPPSETNNESLLRYRQLYLSLDINLLKFRGHNKFVNDILTVLSIFKFPLPAVEFNLYPKNTVKFYPFYF